MFLSFEFLFLRKTHLSIGCGDGQTSNVQTTLEEYLSHSVWKGTGTTMGIAAVVWKGTGTTMGIAAVV